MTARKTPPPDKPAVDMREIQSLEVERAFLHCIIRDPDLLAEVGQTIKPDIFSYQPNRQVFTALRAIYGESKVLDEHLIATRLSISGLTNVGGMSIHDYIGSIAHMTVNQDAAPGYLLEISKFYWARRLYGDLKKCIEYITKNLDLDFAEIRSGTEKLLTKSLSREAVNDNDALLVDLNFEAQRIVQEQIDKKVSLGVDSPFPTFNRWFGQFTVGDLFVFGAPAKVGKSTFLSHIANHVARKGEGKVKVLILDTELEAFRVVCRNVAAETGVNEFYYRTGKYAEDPTKVSKAQEAFARMEKLKGTVMHRYVPRESIEQIESIARRWHSMNVNAEEGEVGVLIYDYLKLTSPSRSSSDGPGSYDLKEYELIGQICNSLKMLSSSLPNTTCITAVQLNEMGQIAQSARIKWFASSIFILQRKTPDEVGKLGKTWGTHKLICVETRNHGEFGDQRGNIKIVKGKEVTWEPDYINIDIDNFKVEERGTYEDALRDGAGQLAPDHDAGYLTAAQKNANKLKEFEDVQF